MIPQRPGSFATAIAVGLLAAYINPTLPVNGILAGMQPMPNAIAPSPSLTRIAQKPALPFPLDGKPVYVRQGDRWQEALLVGYTWNSQSGVRYDVEYTQSGTTEKGVGVDRIKSLNSAQKDGIATTVYDVSSQVGVQQMLNAHNGWRKRTGVSAVTWSPQLAIVAQQWATKLLKEILWRDSGRLIGAVTLAINVIKSRFQDSQNLSEIELIDFYMSQNDGSHVSLF